MPSLMTLIPQVFAVAVMAIAGAVVTRRITGAARGLLWVGLALLSLVMLIGQFVPFLLGAQRGWVLALYGTVAGVLHLAGVLLLVGAVGAAARAARGSSPWPGTPYPQSNLDSPQAPGTHPGQMSGWVNPQGHWSGAAPGGQTYGRPDAHPAGPANPAGDPWSGSGTAQGDQRA